MTSSYSPITPPSTPIAENDLVPEMVDHRHLQMWRWLHNSGSSHSFRHHHTNHSSTSVDSSSIPNSFDVSLDMSSRSTSFGNLVAPSTSFQDFYTLAILQSSPQHQANLRNQLLLLHNMRNSPEEVVEDCDIDVVGLVDTTKEVSLNDRDDVITTSSSSGSSSMEGERISVQTTTAEMDNLPLDLSCKVSPIVRPSVIIGTPQRMPTGNHTSVRRSMSSVSSSSTQDEVAAHFRRSLSGKWPKRHNAKIDEARNSPLRRRPSFNTHSSISSISPTPPPPPTTILVKNHCSDTSLSVADHFRRALSGKKGLLEWQKKQQQSE